MSVPKRSRQSRTDTGPERARIWWGRSNLCGTHVTDAGLIALARPDSGLKALTELDLDGTQVTDAGLIALARPDSGLKALTWLHLDNTSVTDAGVKALQQARPALQIRH